MASLKIYKNIRPDILRCICDYKIGYISTQLHQGIAGSTVLLNYAVWESVAHFRAAFEHPDFKSALAAYPASTIASPHLFTRLSVPNLCIGP